MEMTEICTYFPILGEYTHLDMKWYVSCLPHSSRLNGPFNIACIPTGGGPGNFQAGSEHGTITLRIN